MEAFAAVASGAGLVSLAIQLLESSQKLKGLYNASRNAPRTIEDLCFELETLSLQLRQLERHRHLDRFDTTEILDRCIAVCEQRTMRVRDVVDAMTRYMQRSSTFGGLYTAFKEPEMKKLLVELEQAKSSLSLAYISYCQYGTFPKTLNVFVDSWRQIMEHARRCTPSASLSASMQPACCATIATRRHTTERFEGKLPPHIAPLAQLRG